MALKHQVSGLIHTHTPSPTSVRLTLRGTLGEAQGSHREAKQPPAWPLPKTGDRRWFIATISQARDKGGTVTVGCAEALGALYLQSCPGQGTAVI